LPLAEPDIGGDAVTRGPASALTGEVRVPGDKSISHRAVIFGSIARGASEVEGLLEGEDNLSTIAAFEAMGVAFDRPGPGRLVIGGAGPGGLREPAAVIDAGNSGTTARLLTGLLSAQPFFSVITGDESLRTRPMKRVVEPLSLMGADIDGRGGGEFLPLAIRGGRLKGISYQTPVASAQLKSAILIAGLYADGETVVTEPGLSRDHTERMLALFGADIERREKTVRLRSTNGLNGVKIKVPGDLSSAAFFIVGAAIIPGSDLTVRDVGVNPTRTGVLHILEKMGAGVELAGRRERSGEDVADIRVRGSALRGVEISGEELLPAIDEFPVICVAAAFAEGATTISGAAELRVKESDRISAMASLLAAIGVQTSERPDGIVIEGVGPDGLAAGGGAVESRGDHRVAMSAAVAALRCREPVTIRGASCVDVSFPGFFPLLDSVARG